VGGRVVEPIADHGHHLAVTLQPGHDVGLALRQDLGDDLLNADLVGNGAGDDDVIAGEQDRVRPSRRSCRTASAEVGLTASATTRTPRAPGHPSQP
jgi:hypothetical protein